ncbi:MAG TPA: HEAT repeat domain-containing protein [Chthonomonadaceae bacterium]|nr:HEAT repeat domain-containing protein [Chthonomonadaceae bacterium]
MASNLLTDNQVRQFIAHGYLVLDCGLPPDVHARIYDKLQWILHEEGNPGNNILPAVPEMRQVLDSPVVRGALTSVLGRDYVLHPHRFVHNIEPAERVDGDLKVGQGSASFVGWHQDSHSPLSRPRHHLPRYAMILYYPQDTPPEMGPTQLIPASQYNASISDADRARGFQAPGPAGTCVLVHFDIAHGGSMNLGDRTRHMAKFVFARVEEPAAPSWDCRGDEWSAGAASPAGADHSGAWSEGWPKAVWRYVWQWMCGRAEAPLREDDGRAPEDLIAGWDAGSDARLDAIYRLAAMRGRAAVALCADLAGRMESRWAESAVVMENAAYALAAMGAPAVPALVELLDAPSDWVQINALFALGEIGRSEAAAVPTVIRKLRSRSHAVVRTALDAIGQMQAAHEALPEIRRLLFESDPVWQEPLYRRWTGENQVRFNAIMALLRVPAPSSAVIETAIAALDDPCGYVGGIGVEILLRHRTATGMDAAIAFLQAHRWDNSLNRGIRTY